MTLRPIILLTRPKHDAEQDAKYLEDLGYSPLISPLLNIEPLKHSATKSKKYQAIIFTSANAVRLFKHHDTSQKAFAVGNNTAAALTDAGYKNINNANGTAKDLETLIRNRQNTSDKLAFIRGQDIAYPLAQQLKKYGYKIDEYITYKTNYINRFTQETIKKITDGNCVAITLYSKKTAENMMKIFEKTIPTPNLKHTKLLCISPSVLEYVHSKMPNNIWHSTYSAKTQDRDGMLSLIKQEIKI